MDSAQVIKRLKRDGWTLKRIRSSHHYYTHADRPGLVTVAHPRRDIPVGTLRSIYRQAGWKWAERRR